MKKETDEIDDFADLFALPFARCKTCGGRGRITKCRPKEYVEMNCYDCGGSGNVEAKDKATN